MHPVRRHPQPVRQPCPSTPTSRPAPSRAAAPARRSATSRWASRCRSPCSSRTASRSRPTNAGAELVFCDSKLDTPTALACAQQFAVQGVQGVLNFNVDEKASPEICAAYNDVPTIAIDIIQPPCQVAFMGANNHEAGRLGGAAIGKYAKDTWNCDYTAYVSLESTGAKAASDARMGGYRDGFKEYCPIINEKIRADADRDDKALAHDVRPADRAAGQPHRRGRHQRGRHPRRDGRCRHDARPPEGPHLQRPGRRAHHVEGHRLQPAVHRVGGVLPGATTARRSSPR